ncbi:MAG: DUF2141 domain-containing protein [Bacteroidota bacterium]
MIATLVSFILLSFTPHSSDIGTLQISVENIKVAEGMIWVGLYRSEEDFLIKEKAILVGINVEKEGQMKITMPNLDYGEYAMAIFHDLNNNGEMDRNLVGIPSEPFAFSQKLKSKFKIPKFEDVKFTFEQDQQVLNTTLNKWWKHRG